MKKNYLAPKSETLSAILKDMCAYGDPSVVDGVSATSTGGNSSKWE